MSEEFEPIFVREARSGYGLVQSHRDLKIYQRAFTFSREIYAFSKGFPNEEQFGLTTQIRNSSRSVCANIAEGWRKRRYKAAFISKMNDAEAEAAETQCWLEFCEADGFMPEAEAERLWQEYEAMIHTLVGIAKNADKWTFRP